MIYIRNLFPQDLRDGKQIAFPTEPSNLIFKFNFTKQDPDREISFRFKVSDTNSKFIEFKSKIIKTRIYSSGSESRIDSELKQFLRDELNAQIDDLVIFTPSNQDLYDFEFIPKDSSLYSHYKFILKNKNHEVLIVNENNIDNTQSEELRLKIDLTNLKEKFANWFISFDQLKHKYFTDSFSSNRDRLIEQLTRYEKIYYDQFGTYVFNIENEDLDGFISKLERNLYLEEGEFFDFSLRTSTHMPKAILGKNNYIQFLKDIVLKKELLLQIDFDINLFQTDVINSGLIFSPQLIQRFVASLFTKPFVILTGLSGSGKTKLAQSFAQWICEDRTQYRLISVGSDWTNREPLLGFPNALTKTDYVNPENGVLDLIIDAMKNIENPKESTKPFFLILDEMNLSHVERYFSDFLSAMESGEIISLHKIEDEKISIPKTVYLPKNLFIIGTVNIDETTYMFSPKVLDRANTIEFRLSEEDLKLYINSYVKLDLNKLKTKGANMSKSFIELALKDSEINMRVVEENIVNFFNELKKAGADFGYRTTYEIGKLMLKLNEVGFTHDTLDIAIMQKLLPKLHGSRNKLSKVLPVLGGFCLTDSSQIKTNYFDKYLNNSLTELDLKNDINIKYKVSFEKICKMYKNVIENGYTSYAEA